MKIRDKQITFVVQGPVQSRSERDQIVGITQECLQSIRSHFPESFIILSTWQGQPLGGLDYDHLIELEDPGSNTIYHDGKAITLNNNRQMVSAHMGLREVKTQYAVKIRTDNKVSGRQFVDTYQKYAELPRENDYKYFTQRTMTSSAFFISSHHGRTVHFHKSDLFDFGLTEDLLKIWSPRLIQELHFELKSGYKARYATTEQFLCLNWLSPFVGKELKINNLTNEEAGLGTGFWHRFIANNIIVDSPESLGLDVTERFYKRGNLALEYDLQDWLYLNKKISKPLDRKRIYRAYRSAIGKLLCILKN
ncbi:WavE lipopolysaccharide synthesis family protein [Vibrio lamellibrachiae]|uniref:WavE lipopolysaccharide synthesis family protein n=1 Tax=Vibrio lamellibrachiae TaxID=2910253 RepID=UPI003D11B0A2